MADPITSEKQRSPIRVISRAAAVRQDELTAGRSSGNAALSIPMPTQRFIGNEVRYITALLACRDKINHALGPNGSH